MRVLDLFSGIGGIALGLERAGMEIAAFCEREEFCQKVLRARWPKVKIFNDVRRLNAERLRSVGPIHLIAAGWPCQDISCAGPGGGLAGRRSGLWWEVHRLVEAVSPQYVFLENSPALRSRGADEVLASLEGSGYTCESVVVGAHQLGAHHRRNRFYCIAHTDSPGVRLEPGWTRGPHGQGERQPGDHGTQGLVADTDCIPSGSTGGWISGQWRRGGSAGGCATVADADRDGQRQPTKGGNGTGNWTAHGSEDVADSGGQRSPERRDEGDIRELQAAQGTGRWKSLSGLDRVSHGVPGWLDGSWEMGIPRTCSDQRDRNARLKALGNACVPQIPEALGRAVVEHSRRG